MDEKTQEKDNIWVVCPSCKDKSMRNKAVLKICAYGCAKCGFVGEHLLKRAEDTRKKNTN